MTFGVRVFVVAAAAVLSACATTPPSADGVPWTTGRLSLRADATPQQPAQSLSAAFELRGSGDAGELRLNSPLGTQLVAATWAPGQALLRTPEGERRFSSLEELSRQALGESLPLPPCPTGWPPGPGLPPRTR